MEPAKCYKWHRLNFRSAEKNGIHAGKKCGTFCFEESNGFAMYIHVPYRCMVFLFCLSADKVLLFFVDSNFTDLILFDSIFLRKFSACDPKIE